MLEGNIKKRAQRSAFALYTWDMNKPASQTAKSNLPMQALVVLAVTVFFFLMGGGWKFFSDEELYGLRHNVNSDWEYIAMLEEMFKVWGIAQAIAALLWTVLIISLMRNWRRHLWLWAFFAISIIWGGYKFFLSPGEYFIAPLAGKQVTLPDVWKLPFLVNGGAAGIFAAFLAGLIQWFLNSKPSPNQAP